MCWRFAWSCSGITTVGDPTCTFPTTPQNATTGDRCVTPYEPVPRTSVGNQGAQTTYGGSISSALYKVSESFAAATFA